MLVDRVSAVNHSMSIKVCALC